MIFKINDVYIKIIHNNMLLSDEHKISSLRRIQMQLELLRHNFLRLKIFGGLFMFIEVLF